MHVDVYRQRKNHSRARQCSQNDSRSSRCRRACASASYCKQVLCTLRASTAYTESAFVIHCERIRHKLRASAVARVRMCFETSFYISYQGNRRSHKHFLTIISSHYHFVTLSSLSWMISLSVYHTNTSSLSFHRNIILSHILHYHR